MSASASASPSAARQQSRRRALDRRNELEQRLVSRPEEPCTRSLTSSWSDGGTGSCAWRSAGSRSAARANSSANIGLPREAAWTAATFERGGGRRTVDARAAGGVRIPSGPTVSSANAPGWNASASPSGSGSSASPLKVARTPIGSSPMRRTANESTRADAGSSHWTSSIASSNGASVARARKAATSARGKVSRSGRASEPGSVPRAAARAWRCGSTSSSAISAKTGSRRSETAPSGIGISASAHRDTSTRMPSRSAAATLRATGSSCRCRARRG